MLRLFLLRFWPVLIPVLVYALWHHRAVKQAKKAGKSVPRFSDGPVYWLVIASLAIGVGCFGLWSASRDNVKGAYIPPHMENGTLIPAHVATPTESP